MPYNLQYFKSLFKITKIIFAYLEICSFCVISDKQKKNCSFQMAFWSINLKPQKNNKMRMSTEGNLAKLINDIMLQLWVGEAVQKTKGLYDKQVVFA